MYIHFQEHRAIEPVTCAFANDLRGVHEVIKDSSVDSSGGSAVWSLLCLDLVVPRRLAEEAALSNDNNVLSTEFLLQFTYKAWLNAVEEFELYVGYEDDDCFLATCCINFVSSRDGKLLELSLKLVGALLQIKNSFGYLLLNGSHGHASGLGDLFACSEHCILMCKIRNNNHCPSYIPIMRKPPHGAVSHHHTPIFTAYIDTHASQSCAQHKERR